MVAYIFLSSVGIFLLISEIKRRIHGFSKPKINQIIPSVAFISFGFCGTISIVLGNDPWMVLGISCAIGLITTIVAALIVDMLKTKNSKNLNHL